MNIKSLMFSAALLLSSSGNAIAAETDNTMVIYKSPTCGCCTSWADTMKAANFAVSEKKSHDMDSIKAKYGVPANLSSCHTALIGGYVIEGHVPAKDVQRLLKEKPNNIVGLSAPGMPPQSPGMQPDMLTPKNYDVLAFDKAGKTYVFSRY